MPKFEVNLKPGIIKKQDLRYRIQDEEFWSKPWKGVIF